MVNRKNDATKRAERDRLTTQIEADLLNVLLPTDAVRVRRSLVEKLSAARIDSLVDSQLSELGEVDGVEADAIEVYDNPKAKISYPWNPADSLDALSVTETNDIFNGLDPQEIDDRAQDFFSKLDHLWDQSLAATLSRKFANVPQQILNAIAQQAEKAKAASEDLADQLVNCVQGALPLWATEDLYVFARPVAYTMRGEDANASSPVDLNRNWDSLSKVEQAKLTLTIANYALSQAGEGK
jgi:hypothetical protein